MNQPNKQLYRRAMQITGLLILAFFILYMAYDLRSIFNPVLLSLLLAYILNPVANLFERFKIGRTVTIFSIYIILFTVAVLTAIFIIPLIGAEVDFFYKVTFMGDKFEDKNNNGEYDPGEVLTQDWDGDNVYDKAYIDSGLNWLKSKIDKWNELNPHSQIKWNLLMDRVKDSLRTNLNNVVKGVIDFSGQAMETLMAGIVGIFSILSYVIFVPLYTFFLLKGLNNLRDTLISYIPPSRKDRVMDILHRIHRAVSSFFRGKLIICIMKGVLTWLVLNLMGVKFSLLFGIIQAIASLIPFLVLIVGMIPNCILICLDMPNPLIYTVVAIFFYFSLEGIEGFLLTPWIMGKETGLHPVSIILCLLIGGRLFGFFGLLLAVPVTTTLKILFQELVLPNLREVIGYKDERKVW